METELSDGVIAIRPLRVEDAVAHLAGEDAETARWLSGGVSDIAGTRRWIERSADQWRDGGPTFVFGIWQVEPCSLVGMVEANTDHRQLDGVPEDGANISYGLHAQARGRGYMPRALALLEGFLKDLGIGVAVIRVDPENKASLQVPPRSGFVFQRTIASSQGDQLAIWHRRLDSGRGEADRAKAWRSSQAVPRLLEEIVASHRAGLGHNLVGIYLHGSRATGDHGPNSDVDYLVVAERPLRLDEKRSLVGDLHKLSERAPAHGIEMSVITRATLRRFRHPAPFEFHFSTDWLARYERGQVDLGERRTDPDLASHVVHTRERGKVLYGDAIESVFPPIDRRHHVEATLNDASWIVRNPTANPLYTVLNLCRALAVVKGGMTPSKIEAAEWALETLPQELQPLIKEASRRYRADEPGDGLDQRELAAFVSYVEGALGLRAGKRRGEASGAWPARG